MSRLEQEFSEQFPEAGDDHLRQKVCKPYSPTAPILGW
jgi:hypothetical protein